MLSIYLISYFAAGDSFRSSTPILQVVHKLQEFLVADNVYSFGVAMSPEHKAQYVPDGLLK